MNVCAIGNNERMFVYFPGPRCKSDAGESDFRNLFFMNVWSIGNNERMVETI